MIGWIVQERPYPMAGHCRWVIRAVDRETPKMFFCPSDVFSAPDRIAKDHSRVSQLLERWDEADALVAELEDVYGHELSRAHDAVKAAKGQVQRLTNQSRDRMKSFLAESSDP